jgi:hypothetical protein
MISQRWPALFFILCAMNGFAVQEHTMNFDHDKAEGAPQGWISDGDNWRVIEEHQASSQSHVLVPPHSVLTGGRLTRLLISSATFLNGDVGVRFRTIHEDPPVVFGLLWSFADARNYEEVEINTQSNVFSLISVRNGKPRELASDSFLFTPNTWHLLQIQASPKQLTLYLDNEIVVAQKTSLRKIIGQVGLSVVPNSPIQFDDFAWRAD